MNQALILHCWDGYPEYCWYPQTKKELEALGFKVEVPALPETEAPQLKLWLPVVQELAPADPRSLYFIGHSAGCATILRYLEQLPAEQSVAGVVLVAGFTEDLDYPELSNFFQTPLNLSAIRAKARHFTAIFSDNDPYVDLKYADIFQEQLGAKIIVKHAMKHFSGPRDEEESCLSLPEVTESIQGMMA